MAPTEPGVATEGRSAFAFSDQKGEIEAEGISQSMWKSLVSEGQH